jgi:hypothetical protein
LIHPISSWLAFLGEIYCILRRLQLTFLCSRGVGAANKFAIYEIYADQKAVDAHMASAHLKRWLERTPALLANKSTNFYNIEGADPQRRWGPAPVNYC